MTAADGSAALARLLGEARAVAVFTGARLAILNREPTPLDGDADLVVRGDIGDVLDPL